MDSFEELKDVVRKLRAPDGCPWDKEQTHDSLKPGIERAVIIRNGKEEPKCYSRAAVYVNRKKAKKLKK